MGGYFSEWIWDECVDSYQYLIIGNNSYWLSWKTIFFETFILNSGALNKLEWLLCIYANMITLHVSSFKLLEIRRFFLCLFHVCARTLCDVWRAEDSWQKPILSYFYVCPENSTQVIRLEKKFSQVKITDKQYLQENIS